MGQQNDMYWQFVKHCFIDNKQQVILNFLNCVNYGR